MLASLCQCNAYELREKFVVASKVAGPSAQMTWIRGGPTSLSAKDIREAIDGSLRRLQTDYIDLCQLHWPDRWCKAISSSCSVSYAIASATAKLDLALAVRI